MIKGLAHAAITVRDLAVSLPFYQDLMGFPVVRTMDMADGGKIVILDVGGRGELEIFQRPRQRPLPEGYGHPESIGLWHLALEVDDVAAEWARLEAQGVKPMGKPIFQQPGGGRCCHFYDPDGVVVELIEPPDTWWPRETEAQAR